MSLMWRKYLLIKKNTIFYEQVLNQRFAKKKGESSKYSKFLSQVFLLILSN